MSAGAPARRWKPYPAYKVSAVEWPGEIPAHWEIALLKREFEVQLGKMLQTAPTSSEDTLEPYLRAANIFWNGVDLNDVNEMWFSHYEKGQYVLKISDLLISEGGDVGRTAIWRGEIEHCYIQNAINRVRSKGVHLTRFLYYWIYTLKQSGYIDMLCNKATIAHFTAEKVERVHVILPPLPEQRAIASFLDRRTASLDALISKKERLIELLQEKRAALISRLVTKGLDPNAPMKDSGVEWLGEIPEHWEVKRLKYIAPVSNQKINEKPEELLYLGLENVESKTGCLLLDAPVENVESIVGVFDKGDVLFGKLRPYLSKVVYAEFNGVCTSELLVLKPDSASDGKFIFYQLISDDFIELINSMTYGTKMPRASSEQVGNMFVPLPPFPEQHAIASFLDRETAKIDALIARIREAIEKLREYRTALISAAVTGKIDVRELV